MGEVRDIRCESRPDIVCPVICIQGGGRTSLNANGKGWDLDVSFTLNTLDVHGVAYEIYHPGESSKRFKSEDS